MTYTFSLDLPLSNSSKKYLSEFKFVPLSFSWVAVHPKPKGVIQFIGGAFFGSFPTFFYRYILEYLYLENYTVIAVPFRFTFRHWAVAASLFREQRELRPLLTQVAEDLGYDSSIYSNSDSYIWLGHSLGCKYITLLELLTERSSSPQESNEKMRRNTKKSERQIRQISQAVQDLTISIKNQHSVLMAPDIGNTQDAIKIPLLPEILDKIGLGVLPTKEETFNLIQESSFFNLTSMISFNHDTIAGSIKGKSDTENTVLTLIKILKDKLKYREIKGKHLRPLGIELGETLVGPIAASPNELLPQLSQFIELHS